MSLVIWGNAESSICIMAASIPILRALVREGFQVAVPLGYRTDEIGYTGTMTESRVGNSVIDRSGMFGRQLAAPIPAPATQRRGFNGSDSGTFLDRTLVNDSPEPDLKPPKRSDEEWSDDDSIEMSNYQHRRAQTPRDFLHNPI